jgi:hypothetical protein
MSSRYLLTLSGCWPEALALVIALRNAGLCIDNANAMPKFE